MEAAGLGLFMVSAGAFGTLLEAADSPLRQAIADPLARRALMGLSMGMTAMTLVYSPWGKQSGAHLNPAVTLTFLRLGKVRPCDAVFYVAAQLAGGTLGVLAVLAVLGRRFAAPPVSYVATLPGAYGPYAAFAAEVMITGLLMGVVLWASNTPRWARFTGVFAGALVAFYITVEAPISGMSMNPARSFASAAPGAMWDWLWIYLVAPPLGALLAAQLFLMVRGPSAVSCAKLHHHNRKRCIFCMTRPTREPDVHPAVASRTAIMTRSGIIV